MEFDKSKKILIIGRAGMDIYPEPPGTKISDSACHILELLIKSANQ